HAWMWMLGASVHGETSPLLAAHPEWADRSADGSPFARSGSRMAWLDPGRPEVRAWLAQEAARVASAYGVDGIHLDYVRYNDELHDPFGYSEHALTAFRRETGIDLTGRDPASLSPAESEAWKRWRESQVTALVQAVRDAVQAAAPGALLSAAVLPERVQARLMHLQDWMAWLADGLIDLAVPMAYTSSQANLQDVLATVSAELDALAAWRAPDALRVRIAPGLALFATRPDTLPAQVEAVRQGGFGGVVLFSTSYLSLPLREALAQGPFARPAAHPPRLRDEMAALPSLPPQPLPRPAVAPAPAGTPAGPNLARSAAVEVDSSFRGYSPAPLNDGQRNDVPEVGRWAEVAWASAERPTDHWVELRWPRPQVVTQVDIYWALDRGRFFPSSRLRVEAYLEPEGRWETLWAYEAEPSNRIARTSITFAPITVGKLRLVQPAGGGPAGRPDLMWVAEVEVYGPGGADGPAPDSAVR
ncbi:MAG TPA: family 10 glycosylhydrolase, partial [Limnochordales bacterium]